ncbi:helix-turn-helix transcriptional regulator [Ekhidna sp.]|jgi:transcriptional regulator with XRE-family HTH domain|uniref:helix-turn-helix domain-containing protein n=1 Tax=Ekhidna sp. TaxID=2608089 RepID=UPI0032EFF467
MKIGERIKEVCDARGMSYAEFARRIDMTPQNVNSLFKRDRMDSRLLETIGKVLEHNFFNDLANQKHSSQVLNEPAPKYENTDTLITQVLVTLDGTTDTLNAVISRLSKVNAALV